MTPQEAVEYLAQQVEGQAGKEGVQLSRAERRMLRWSEIMPGMECSPELNEQLENEIGTEAFEEKVSGLLRNARAAGTADADRWAEALKVLRGEDAYILVMLSETKTSAPRSIKDQLALFFWGTVVVGVALALGFSLTVYEDAVHEFMQRYAGTDRQRLAITVGAFAILLAVGWIWRAWWSRHIERLFRAPEE